MDGSDVHQRGALDREGFNCQRMHTRFCDSQRADVSPTKILKVPRFQHFKIELLLLAATSAADRDSRLAATLASAAALKQVSCGKR